jgi:AcrR family transcriptional regulator
MKNRILEAASEVLVQRGLNGWTVDEVARKANCAKGLVNYHYGSKHALLLRVAEFLRDRRWMERRDAAKGDDALDRLWQTVIDEVHSGRFSAWLCLVSAGGSLQRAAAATDQGMVDLSRAIGEALGLGDELVPRKELLAAGLDGLGLELLQGRQASRLEETWHRFMVSVLDVD